MAIVAPGENGELLRCGGVVVSATDDRVLFATAGHCYPYVVRVALGETVSLSDPNGDVKVPLALADQLSYDLAVLELKEPAGSQVCALSPAETPSGDEDVKVWLWRGNATQRTLEGFAATTLSASDSKARQQAECKPPRHCSINTYGDMFWIVSDSATFDNDDSGSPVTNSAGDLLGVLKMNGCETKCAGVQGVSLASPLLSCASLDGCPVASFGGGTASLEHWLDLSFRDHLSPWTFFKDRLSSSLWDLRLDAIGSALALRPQVLKPGVTSPFGDYASSLRRVALPCSDGLRRTEDAALAHLIEAESVLEGLQRKGAQVPDECQPSEFRVTDPLSKENAETTRQLATFVRSALGDAGYHSRLAVVLQPGFVFDQDLSPRPVSVLMRVESMRKGPAAFEAYVGLVPSTVYTPRAPFGASQDGPSPTPPVTVSLENAFASSLGLSLNRDFGRQGRAGGVAMIARLGITSIRPSTILTGQGSTVVVATIDETQKRGPFWEIGGRFHIAKAQFDESPVRAVLRPLWGLEAGARHDKRLRDLGRGGGPWDRAFVRLSLGRLPIFSDEGRIFDLTLRLDHEFCVRRACSLGDVTRVTIQGNLDLARALRGKSN